MDKLKDKPKVYFYQIAIASLISLLMGGAPGYFLMGPSKPSRKEVSVMIQKEAPVTVYQTLKKLEIQQAEMRIDLKNILARLRKGAS